MLSFNNKNKKKIYCSNISNSNIQLLQYKQQQQKYCHNTHKCNWYKNDKTTKFCDKTCKVCKQLKIVILFLYWRGQIFLYFFIINLLVVFFGKQASFTYILTDNIDKVHINIDMMLRDYADNKNNILYYDIWTLHMFQGLCCLIFQCKHVASGKIHI